MSNSFRFLNEHKQKWRLNVGDTVKKCPKSWEWPCLVTLSGPRATGFMKLYPHGLKNRFPVKFPIPKMPSMFFQQYTICYTMLYYITVILIHYIYLYINIFYIYIYVYYTCLYLYTSTSLYSSVCWNPAPTQVTRVRCWWVPNSQHLCPTMGSQITNPDQPRGTKSLHPNGATGQTPFWKSRFPINF